MPPVTGNTASTCGSGSGSSAVVVRFSGSRSTLRSLFAQADDSHAEIASYIEHGDVFVARCDGRIVGHVQLVADRVDWEIKSLAVIEEERRRGIGTALVSTAVQRAFRGGATRVRVATATADIGSLRFYQRLGFRMDYVDRDAFTAARGYRGREVDGIAVRDRVWFSMARPSARGGAE